MRARSTAASVCPARTSTPPSRAFNGNMCPGRTRSDGRVRWSIIASTVAARSLAETPVLVTPLASTETEKAVPSRAVFSPTICGKSSSARRDSVIGTQIRPHPYRAMKLIASGVIFSAAIVKSPFVLPILVVDDDDHLVRRGTRRSLRRSDANGDFFFRAVLAIRSSNDRLQRVGQIRGQCSAFRQRRHAGEFCDANDVLPENVTFQIDRISRLRKMQVCMLPRIRE